MALSNVLSNLTKTTPSSGELSTTATDMTQLFAWEFGDPEPKGTHAKNYAPHRRYRQDMRRGAFESKRYNNNVIWVNPFKTVSDQLSDLK